MACPAIELFDVTEVNIYDAGGSLNFTVVSFEHACTLWKTRVMHIIMIKLSSAFDKLPVTVLHKITYTPFITAFGLLMVLAIIIIYTEEI